MLISDIEKIQKQLNKKELPGREAQLAFAKNLDRNKNPKVPDDAVPAATLCLLLPSTKKDGTLDFVLIERSSHTPDDPHAGQISFPGGRKNSTDSNTVDTALREAEEEVGIKGNDVNILGKLSDLFITVSNYNVSPYVGYINYIPSFERQESEVNNIIVPSVSDLLRPDIISYKDIEVRDISLQQIPYFDLNNKVVWGATAMMLSEFKVILKRI